MFAKGVQLDMRLTAYFAIPASTSKKRQQLMRDKVIRPTKKPDMDNIIKIIADALNGIAYYDDSQIVDTAVRKFYSDEPRVVVKISEVESFTDNYPDYKSFQNELKEKGWMACKIHGEWHDFCSEYCRNKYIKENV